MFKGLTITQDGDSNNIIKDLCKNKFKLEKISINETYLLGHWNLKNKPLMVDFKISRDVKNI